ncbi:MAG: BCCT family transporter [Oligoflexales bacterium]|nr:BCCT family transporter [Oligoflexales bacterium]
MTQAIQTIELSKQFVEHESPIDCSEKANRTINPPSIGLIATLGLISLAVLSLYAKVYQETSQHICDFIAKHFSGFYSATMNVYILVCMLLLVSPLGKVRLSADPNERPQFSTLSWLTMLFSGGMGIGLFFYGVVEPLSHHAYTFKGNAQIEKTLSLTVLHWGVHPWSCYAMVGLCFAFFAYCKKQPFSIRSCLPNMGKKESILGNLIEAATVICPVVGVASSLGLGAMQISQGLGFSFGLDAGLGLELGVIVTITIVSTMSVASGVDKGMKFLSNLNIFLAFILLSCIVLFISPSKVFSGLSKDFVTYFSELWSNTVWSTGHDYLAEGSPLNWTTSHWSSWIAWAPFVGMFIARISKGRTIREFILGVVAVPSIVSVAWFSLLGRSSIEIFGVDVANVRELIDHNLSTAFFMYLSKFSGSLVLYGLAIICLKLFFITSSDSAALVIATTAVGGEKPSKRAKVYWSLAIAVLAVVFMVSGGLQSMQVVTIASAIPFASISLAMIVYLVWQLHKHHSSSMPSHKS